MGAFRAVSLAVATVFFFIHAGTCNICVPTCHLNGELLPDPVACGKFYQCAHGRPFHMPCPLGLHFSPSLLRCDYPVKANCTSNPLLICSVPSSNQTIVESVIVTTQAPISTSAPVRPIISTAFGQATEITVPQTNVIITQAPRKLATCTPQCPWPGAYLAHPQDCTKFYICDGQPKAVLFSCQAGLWYNMDTLRCDYPEIAVCKASPQNPCNANIARSVQTFNSPISSPRPPTQVVTTTQVPDICVPPCPSPEALYPHPHDCTKYFHCAQNVPYLRPCPVGQQYSGPLARCDYPELAQCTASPAAPCVAATYPPQTTASPCKPLCLYPYAYMPHPQDCTKFYICDGQKNAFESSCPPGLLFSMDTVQCDYPDIANCIAGPLNACDANIAP